MRVILTFLYRSLCVAYYVDNLSNYFRYTDYTTNLRKCQSQPMSPRPYRLGQRQAATELTRARILNAARELLMSSNGYSHFSIDAIARQADVARMTVYHQFGSKIGLLEGLCDSVAASGGMEHVATTFRQAEPLDTLREYLLVFSHFWEVDRLVMRRLRALAALDPDFEHVIRTRDEWRRRGVRAIMQQIIEKQPPLP